MVNLLDRSHREASKRAVVLGVDFGFADNSFYTFPQRMYFEVTKFNLTLCFGFILSLSLSHCPIRIRLI